jgi:hypothetical protein
MEDKVKHRWSKRDNPSCAEIRGVPMFKCICGKRYQTKAQAEAHCRKMEEKNV